MMTTSATALRVEDVSKQFGQGSSAVMALRNVDVSIDAGAFTGIMGPSGSGKSTLMHCMAGLDRVTSGNIHFRETDLTSLGDEDITRIRREHFGFVFQQFNLLPAFSARDNIMIPARLAGKSVDKEWFSFLVSTLGVQDRLNNRPSEMSGGQQQRVAIARALILNPSLVFCDEPTGNLDTRSGTDVLTALRRSADERGVTIVMVTHDPRAASYCDRVVFLSDGQIVNDLTSPDELHIFEAMRGMEV